MIWLLILIDCPIGRPSGGSAKGAAELFECRICYRHISSVGAGLARDAGTSFYLDDRSAAIAGKPAPTRDGCCLKFLLLLLPLDCPGDANAHNSARVKAEDSIASFLASAAGRQAHQKGLPLASGLRCVQVPSCRLAPWARRDGPSLAQRGSPGIHAGRPTAQNHHSASRWGGRSKSIARARARARSRSTIFRFQGGVTVALRVPTGSKHHLAWAPDRLSVTCRSVPSGWSCPTPCTGRPAARR